MNVIFEKIITNTLFIQDAFAQVVGKSPPPPSVVGKSKSLQQILNDLINWSVGLGLLIATIVIIYAAFLILTAGGNSDRVSDGKKAITYAIIGVVILLLSRGIIEIIRQLIGV